MKQFLYFITYLICIFASAHVSLAQEVAPATADIDFVVESTAVKRLVAVEPAPLSGMIPVEKEVTITQNIVADPQLPDPVPAAPHRDIMSSPRCHLRQGRTP